MPNKIVDGPVEMVKKIIFFYVQFYQMHMGISIFYNLTCSSSYL